MEELLCAQSHDNFPRSTISIPISKMESRGNGVGKCDWKNLPQFVGETLKHRHLRLLVNNLCRDNYRSFFFPSPPFDAFSTRTLSEIMTTLDAKSISPSVIIKNKCLIRFYACEKGKKEGK